MSNHSNNALEIIQLRALQDNYIYVLHDSVSAETAVIDPAQAQPVLELLKQKGWQLNYIFNTHHHSDHVGGNAQLKQHTGCIIIGSEVDKQRIPAIDKTVVEGESLYLGNHKATVIEARGHTHGHILYYFQQDKALFCGDTLFGLGCGRLFEGTAGQLWQSLQKIKALPVDTRCYCAHEYTQANARFAISVEPDNEALQQRIIEINQLRSQHQATIPTTVGLELATNPFLREHSLSVQQNIHRLNAEPVAIFTQLRYLKDNFKN
jgi:hydroxyacylglutathione hydrolase